MINALSSTSNTMSNSGANPASTNSTLPSQGQPMMNSAAPVSMAGGSSNAPKSGLAQKFTPKVMVGLFVLILLVVGSGFALFTAQKAAQQAGIGDIAPKAAGETPQYHYAGMPGNYDKCANQSCNVGAQYEPYAGYTPIPVPNPEGVCYVNHWKCDGLEGGGGCQDGTPYSGKSASFSDRTCGTEQIDTMPGCCADGVVDGYSFCESISVIWDEPCVSPSPEPEVSPSPTPVALTCNSVCTSDAACQAINPEWSCSPTESDGISWDAAEPWSGPIPVTSLPGTGGVQAQGSFVIPAVGSNPGQLIQTLWRQNQGWSRAVPMNSDGTPNWNAAPAWSGPAALSTLPGAGPIKTQVNVVMPTAPTRTLIQAFWRGDSESTTEGWMRTVPFNSDNLTINYAAASPWTGPIAITSIPGTGTMLAQDGYVINNTYFQSFSRGTENWFRSVPLEAGIPNWSAASAWTSAPIANLPGSGELDTNNVVILGNNYVLQALWQNQEGWSRLVPIGRRCRLATNLGSPQCAPTGGVPSPTPVTPIACSWLQVVTPNGGGNLMPGQAALIGSAATQPVTHFYYAVYNKDNLYDNGTPKPVCVTSGGDVTITDENGDQCPGANVHHLIFENSNHTSRLESGNISRTYEQIFLNDTNFGGAKLVHAQFNAYMSVDNGPWTAPVAACVKYATAVEPTPTPNSPSPFPSQTPSPSPSPTPTLPPSPTPVGPMCMSISMSPSNPTLGSNVTFTCGLVNGAAWYDFRVVSPAGKIIHLDATGRTSSPYTVDAYGTYYAQCRFCTTPVGTSCDQPFEPLPGGVLPSPTIAPATPSPDPNIDPPPEPILSPSPSATPVRSPMPPPQLSPIPSPTMSINPSPTGNPGTDRQ